MNHTIQFQKRNSGLLNQIKRISFKVRFLFSLVIVVLDVLSHFNVINAYLCVFLINAPYIILIIKNNI